MRRWRACLVVNLGLAAAATAATAAGVAGPGTGATAGCVTRPCLAAPLPAALTITTDHARFFMARDGGVQRVRTPATAMLGTAAPRGAALFPETGTWYVIRAGHLLVGRGRKVLWRSRRRVPSTGQVGVVMESGGRIAFQHSHQLWLARAGRPERPVAARELPLGWTRDGLYTYRYRDHALVLRNTSGRLLAVVARRPLGSDFLVTRGSLYFIAGGVLRSARGGRARGLAGLRALGLGGDAWLAPMGRLLELMDDRRLVLVRPDGAVFASMPQPRGVISGGPVVDPGGKVVALTAATGLSAGDGSETTLLLHEGARSARALHTEAVASGVCERGAGLQWKGRWLLYDNSEGNVALIDTGGGRRVIDLTAAVRRLPGTGRGFDVTWATGGQSAGGV